VHFLLNSCHGDVGDSTVTIKDTGDLLEGRALGLRVDEVHEDEFDGDPALVRISSACSHVWNRGKLTV
jgi:hypothetical protein